MGAADIRSANQAGANIVALCDVDDQRAAQVYRDFPDAKRYTDFRRLLDGEKNIDAVIVATPDHTHATITMAAMERGKHVYCEKPLAHTLYEVRMITEAARKYGVATQLGNQGHSFKAIHEFRECIRSGAIGQVREVHAQQSAFGYSRIGALARMSDDHAVPDTLNWDLWLGPAAYRKYNPLYLPSSWRGWRAFGSGNMGDFVCHIVDPVFWALDLGAPVSVVAEAAGYDPEKHRETFPQSSKVRFEFPARGDRPAVTLYWYDGDRYQPPHPEELPAGAESIPDPGWVAGKPVGALVVGDKGKIVYGSHGARGWRIIPEAKMRDYVGDRELEYEQNTSGLPTNLAHHVDWLRACKGGSPAGSNFDYGGPLTEIASLGDIALRMLGTQLDWDAEHLMFPNQPIANQYLHTQYREGWTL
jgi:predicted dehydrogenase